MYVRTQSAVQMYLCYKIMIYCTKKKLTSCQTHSFLQYFQNFEPENPRNKLSKIVVNEPGWSYLVSQLSGEVYEVDEAPIVPDPKHNKQVKETASSCF